MEAQALCFELAFLRRIAPHGMRYAASRIKWVVAAVFQTEGGMVMKARMIVFVIGIASAVLGCATNEGRDDQFSRARGARYSAPASAPDSGWYGAITVNPRQVFEN